MSAEPIDLLVLGAGPAGMRATVEAAGRGLRVVVVDEGRGPGGQVYRATGSSPLAGDPVLGEDYAKGAALAEAFRSADAAKLFAAGVFMVEPQADSGFLVAAAGAGPARLFRAAAVIVAAGAHERPMPIPGWTLPGVMTAGAAQTLLKASGLVPQGPAVIAGTGPLIYLLASQYARAGVRLEALIDTTPAENWRRALPHLPGFLMSAYARKGLGLLAEVLRGMPIHAGADGLRAEGRDRVEAVRFRSGGRERILPADTLLLHQGVVPQVNLAMAVGARHVWNDRRRAFEPVRAEDCESSVRGFFIAGDGGGIGGAEAAEAEGAIAALAVLERLGKARPADRAAVANWRGRRSKALRGRAFLDALHRPSDAQCAPADEVVACRCEEATAGEIREAVRLGARGPNQAKAFTRAGMGPCQGRMCGLTVAAIIAAETGLSPDEVGYMRLRMPVKPVTVGQMASLANGDEGE